MITVVDYKLNNLRSIENTLKRLGHEVEVTSSPDKVRAREQAHSCLASAPFGMRWPT
jgi:imidazoleglycerol phosphate synthase glutamine amidotransferase subunit HisH